MNNLFRRQRHLTHQENEIRQKLLSILTRQDFETISALTDRYTSRVYTQTKERQTNKFRKLLAEHRAGPKGKPPSPNDAHLRCVTNLSKRSLVPRHQIFRVRPAALSKNRVWTPSLVKLGRNYMSVVSCCRTNQIAQVK